MSDLENNEKIKSLETKLRELAERERQLNEFVRYYKGRVDVLLHTARKEGRVHVFGESIDPRQSTADQGKFRTAKRRFASIYHPDAIKHEGIERIVREEVFKEFWNELEKIESAP